MRDFITKISAETEQIYYELYTSSQELPIIGIFNPARISSSNNNNSDGNSKITGPAWSFIHPNNFSPLTNSEKNHRCSEFITDIVWNMTGSALASIDQRGKIFIWTMVSYINRWTCFRDFDLGENIIEFSWLDHLRPFSKSTQNGSTGQTLYKRNKHFGYNNNFGEYSFITVTADGKVFVYHQPAKKSFSTFTARLPYPSCRISHANIILNDDILPKVALIYDISIDLLKSQVCCHLIGNVQLTAPIDEIFSPHAQLIHLKLLPRTSTHPIRLLIITADKTGKYILKACFNLKRKKINNCNTSVINQTVENNVESFDSDITMWELITNKESQQKLDGGDIGSENFTTEQGDNSTLSTDRFTMTLKFVIIKHIPKQLITGIWQHGNELAIGSNDGKVQFCDCSNMLKTLPQSGPLETTSFKEDLFPTFSSWVPSNYTQEDSAILEFSSSPNGTMLLCRRLTGKLNFLDMAQIGLTRSQFDNNFLDFPMVVKSCADVLTLSILNGIDHVDLENVIKKHEEMLGIDEFLEIILEETFTNLATVFPNITEYSMGSDYLLTLFGIQLSLLKSCGRDNTVYLNTLYFIQLSALEKIFLDYKVSDGKFSIELLRSMTYITIWILDFAVFLIKDIHLLFFTIKKGHDLGSEKSHIVLFYNPITRNALKNLIILVGQFKETLYNLSKQNSSDSAIYELNKSLQFSFDKWPLDLAFLKSFIDESFEIIEKAMKGVPDKQKIEYKVIIRSKLSMFPSLHGTLKDIEQSYKTNFSEINKVKLYYYDTEWIKSDSVDILLKSRTIKEKACTRCGNFSATTSLNNMIWTKANIDNNPATSSDMIDSDNNKRNGSNIGLIIGITIAIIIIGICAFAGFLWRRRRLRRFSRVTPMESWKILNDPSTDFRRSSRMPMTTNYSPSQPSKTFRSNQEFPRAKRLVYDRETTLPKIRRSNDTWEQYLSMKFCTISVLQPCISAARLLEQIAESFALKFLPESDLQLHYTFGGGGLPTK
ncbi:13237_t:CDS:10 [Entrophospora sp. SA101]|nr:18042_t:CDS:10 [Entrophospora sp. SA101]CAJ0760410.1 13237_t:CDS:10 [Entrophospora sp. SA101]